MAKASEIYDYVIANYAAIDKSGTGLGQWRAIWRACTAKRGNCTDFHRVHRNDAGAGFPRDLRWAPAARGAACRRQYRDIHLRGGILCGTIGGFVDWSEAWSIRKRRSIFSGHPPDDNRVQFNVGREIRLDPSRQGENVKLFIILMPRWLEAA